METNSEASYCERETWDEWGSRSSLSQQEEVATQSSGQEDVVTLRNERDALARALAAEKQKAASAARAHDARLAELHGVIAELVRRRAQDKSARAIPEEEVSDECESTTQPAGELDNDADRSRTEQNDTSSLSPAELPSPLEAKPELKELPDDTTDTSTQEMQVRVEQPRVEVTTPQQSDPCDTSVNYSERDSEICVSTARCCQYARAAHLLGDSYEVPEDLLPPSPGRCESRQAKLASRVRLRRTEETDSSNHLSTEETRVNVIEESALRLHDEEDLLALDPHDGGDFVEGGVCGARCAWWRARCRRLQADCRLLDCALARALHTAHRLTCACAAQESSCVALCSALRAADRALETYDVLLALAETQHRQCEPEREAAELVALQLLARLEAGPTLPEPLLSPGPWLPPNHHHHQDTPDCGYSACLGSGAVPRSGWSAALEARLRRQAARLKADTVALRAHNPKPRLFSRHDAEEEDSGGALADVGVPEMEAAVALQEAMAIREKKALERMMRVRPDAAPTDSCRSRRRKERERHWLESHASETDL